jgi:hypothetical protein
MKNSVQNAKSVTAPLLGPPLQRGLADCARDAQLAGGVDAVVEPTDVSLSEFTRNDRRHGSSFASGTVLPIRSLTDIGDAPAASHQSSGNHAQLTIIGLLRRPRADFT